MSSRWVEELAHEEDLPAGSPAAARAYYWASIAYHRASSFGHFPHPRTAPLKNTPPESSAAAAANAEARLGSALVDVISRRRSEREFPDAPLAREELCAVTWAAYGAIAGGRRTVPSGGALYPLELMVLVRSVTDLRPGLYRAGDAGEPSGDPTALEFAPQTWFVTQHVDYRHVRAMIFVIGRLDRAASVYGERGYRFIHLEAGHVGQNVSLAAASLGLGCLMIGGFADDAVNRALALAVPDQFVVYTFALGGRAG